MGLVQFCLSSFFFFMTPSLTLMSMPKKEWLAGTFLAANLVLLFIGLWLFPQISRESLAFGTLMSDLYCYLVLLIGVFIGSVIKAIELKYFLFIPFIVVSLLISNGIAVLYSFY